jgi:hypothetical protein
MRLSRLIAGGALGSIALALSGAATAFPDARVEAQLRPDFGLLLKPHLHRHHHHWGIGGCVDCGPGYGGPGYAPGYPGPGYGGPGYVPDYGPGHGPIGPMLDAASVDCDLPPQAVHLPEIVARLNPGATLIIKPGPACVGTLFIDKPITIEGAGDRPYLKDIPTGPDNVDEAASGPAKLLAPPDGGMPCIVVRIPPDTATDHKRRVVLRNLYLESGPNNDESCLDIEQGDVQLEDVAIDYEGHGAAVFVGNGTLITGRYRGEEETDDSSQVRRETAYIQAPHAENAIDVDGGQVEMRDTLVRGGQVGVNLESGEEGSTLDSVRLVLPQSEESARGFAMGSAGVAVSGRGVVGTVVVRDSFICGYGIGVFVEAANVAHIDRNYICQAGKGVYAAGGQLEMSYNSIAATNIGIELGAAQSTDVRENDIYGTANEDRNRGGDYFIYEEPGPPHGGIHDNYFYSSDGLCAWVRVDDRYFHGRRRPWRDHWADWYYLPAHHARGFGTCKDPADWSFDDMEVFYFHDAASAEHYGVRLGWPAQEFRVGEPYDGYDWGNPWWQQRGGPRGDRR